MDLQKDNTTELPIKKYSSFGLYLVFLIINAVALVIALYAVFLTPQQGYPVGSIRGAVDNFLFWLLLYMLPVTFFSTLVAMFKRFPLLLKLGLVLLLILIFMVTFMASVFHGSL